MSQEALPTSQADHPDQHDVDPPHQAQNESVTLSCPVGAGWRLLDDLMEMALPDFRHGRVHDAEKFYFIAEFIRPDQNQLNNSEEADNQVEYENLIAFKKYFRSHQIPIFAIFSFKLNINEKRNQRAIFLRELLPHLREISQSEHRDGFEAGGIIISPVWGVMLLEVSSSQDNIENAKTKLANDNFLIEGLLAELGNDDNYDIHKLVILPTVSRGDDSPRSESGCHLLYSEDLKNLDEFFRDFEIEYSGDNENVFNTHANRRVFNELAPLLAALKTIQVSTIKRERQDPQENMAHRNKSGVHEREYEVLLNQTKYLRRKLANKNKPK